MRRLSPRRSVRARARLGLAAPLVLAALAAGCAATEAAAPPPPRATTEHADPRARELALATLARMGGAEAWDETRYLAWTFMGRRRHLWDKHGGLLRLESGEDLVLLDLGARTGRAWRAGAEVTDPGELAEALEGARRAWINDAYWMFMPYKLLDPGVHLAYAGEGTTLEGRAADVLELTFDAVGVTPQNRYLVYVARESGLVEQWDFFPTREATEPAFQGPWSGWRRFGRIWLATDHGRGHDWEIAVPPGVPARAFTDPAPVEL